MISPINDTPSSPNICLYRTLLCDDFNIIFLNFCLIFKHKADFLLLKQNLLVGANF